ncbi:MAG: hypothetical protein GQ574_18020 [Crocinitomix sp.]|nr:hypothetical protein [Crocinitomix sp.]
MKKILFSTLCVGLLLMSCKKHEIIPEPTPTSNLSSYYADKIEEATQTFNLSNATGGYFTGENGVQILVPANAFVYTDGTPVIGTINFELIEVLDYNTMVLLNKSTTSDGELLVSGGQLKLTATKGGTEVLLADGVALDVYVPTTSPDEEMGLFEGIEDEDGFVEWGALEDTVVIIETEDTVGEASDYYYFEFVNEKLGWINCDYTGWPDGAKTTVTCILDEEYIYGYTSVYAVFPGYNSVYSFYPVDYDLSEFSGTSIPVGIDAKFVALANIDDVFYSCFTGLTNVVADHEEVMSMSVTTLEDIEEAIADL